jgi:hypothetical protein
MLKQKTIASGTLIIKSHKTLISPTYKYSRYGNVVINTAIKKTIRKTENIDTIQNISSILFFIFLI